jgi:hypothetical protein
MLSTINWVNRGHATDDLDLFGANENVVRSIVDRAIDDWERVIVNFNYGDGTNTYNLTVLGYPGFPGQTVQIMPDAAGKPRSATVRLNPTTSRYFDTVTGTAQVPDDSEYDELITPFSAGGGPVNLLDMYSVVSHEIGHALGVVYQSDLAIHSFVNLNVWAIDPVNPGDGCPPNEPGCADPGNHVYPVMVNGQAKYTMTDAGGLDYPNLAPAHLYEGPVVNNWPIHPHDLLNDGRTSDLSRRLMSDTTVGFLGDIYGYTVALPSQTNTFYANFNTTTGSLKVQGDPDDADDFITIDVVGANVRVQVNGTSELVPSALIHLISISSGDGDDTININALPTGLTVSLSASTGNDTINIANGDADSQVLSPIGITGSSGNDSVRLFDQNDTGNDTYTITNLSVTKPGTAFGGLTYGSENILVVTANEFANTINIESLPGNVSLTVNGRGGDDTIIVGGQAASIGGAVNGNVSINAGDLFDTDDLIFDDTNGTGQDIYLLNGGNYQQTDTQIMTFTGANEVELRANNQISAMALANTFSYDVTVQGNGGDDFIDFGFGVLAGMSDATVFGGAGSDTLRLNDTSALAATTFLANQTGGLPFVDLFNGSQLVTYDSIANLTLDAGPFADSITSIAVPSVTSLHINGNGGDDFIDVQGHPTQNNALLPRVTVDGGAGNENVQVNTDGQGSAYVDFTLNQILDRLALGTSAHVRLTSGNRVIEVLSSVVMPSSGAELDLTDGNFVRRNSTNYAFYDARVISGYNAGAWDGLGISSSTAEGTKTGDGLGLAVAGDLFGGGAGNIGGIALAAGDLIVRYTLYGDANLDRSVNVTDLGLLATNWQLSSRRWNHGDSNYDHSVNVTDLGALATNWQIALPAAPATRRIRTALIDTVDFLT